MVGPQELSSIQSVSPAGCVSPDEINRCIEMFFYRTGMDIDAINVSNSSVRDMVAIILGLEQSEISGPSYHNLSQLKRIERRVKEIQSSWKTTGCSVLVDGWRDEQGRDLINVLVDCPQGPIYLKSSDISSAMGDYDALLLVFDKIIEEVGADNVIQIISNYTLSCMKVVGKLFMEKHPTIFWTVSSSHCLELMLENIGRIDSIKTTLNNARTLTKFIYSRTTVLMLMRSHTSSSEILKSTKIKSTMPFLTLENIVREKKNLEKMFSSSVWRSSEWASTADGNIIAGLIRDSSFWNEANVVLKATLPLVRALHLIHESAEPLLGFIYETMDQVKETIRQEFEEDETQYMPYWKVIDELWNNCLHNPLHSAAYYLNPRFAFSKDFYPDAEVFTGLSSCIAHLVEEKKRECLIFGQFGLYATGKGPFGRDDAIQQSSSISSVNWWSSYSKECPELQSLAIRILKQTCDGASKYHLNRSLAEKLFTEGRDEIDQQLSKDIIFCHYNIQLQRFVPGPRNHCCKIDPMNDWIVDETLDKALLSSEPTWREIAARSQGARTSIGQGTSRSAQRK